MASVPLDSRHVWGILVNHAGAIDADSNWVQFRQWWDRYDGGYDEFRFMGDLGFGGKLHRSRDGLRVSCYPESMTFERQKIIETTNAALCGSA